MLGNQQEEELPVKDIRKTDENNNHKRKSNGCENISAEKQDT